MIASRIVDAILSVAAQAERFRAAPSASSGPDRARSGSTDTLGSRRRRHPPHWRTCIACLGLAWLRPATAAGQATHGPTFVPSPETPDRRVVFEATDRAAWLERNEPAWADGHWEL